MPVLRMNKNSIQKSKTAEGALLVVGVVNRDV